MLAHWSFRSKQKSRLSSLYKDQRSKYGNRLLQVHLKKWKTQHDRLQALFAPVNEKNRRIQMAAVFTFWSQRMKQVRRFRVDETKFNKSRRLK